MSKHVFLLFPLFQYFILLLINYAKTIQISQHDAISCRYSLWVDFCTSLA